MRNPRGPQCTYLIGRSAEADIVLGDASVSRLHAELVRGKDGTWYLTDRNSTGGTYLHSRGEWVPVKQGFVRAEDRVMLGAYACGVDDLLRRIPDSAKASSASDGVELGSVTPLPDDRPAGPVRRDPVTGDILSVEDD